MSAMELNTSSDMKTDQTSSGLDSGNKVNILIVDDIPEKLFVYKTILEDLGQNVILAHSGEEALKLILKHDFAVILLDVNMPGMDGFETATLIRQRKKSAGTPIIFLTAFNDDVSAAQGYASGAVDYLFTPVMPEILKAKIKVFIELSQMRLRAASQAEERARRTAAEESDRRKDEFLGMLAHELRNPLGPIKNAVTLLQLAGATDPRTRQLQEIIARQVTHMSSLIDDLLDATRLARGQILLRKDPCCDLTAIVRQTAEDYTTALNSNNIALRLDLPDYPLLVNGDPTRLVQAVGNLLHNANKFTDPGGKISISLQKGTNQEAVLSIRDSGIGIDPAILPNIFEVFRQAEQGLDRNRGGLGLGLSLVKGLVELHGGSVQGYSDGLRKGSTFVIRLPLQKNQTLPLPFETTMEVDVSADNKVLVIEDNKDSADSTSMLLSRDGFNTMVAHSGHDGIVIARKFKPHVILCDIGLPGMDGYEIARAIRSDEELKNSSLIALTGYGRQKDQEQAKNAGFNYHLTKPVDYGALKETLAKAIRKIPA